MVSPAKKRRGAGVAPATTSPPKRRAMAAAAAVPPAAPLPDAIRDGHFVRPTVAGRATDDEKAAYLDAHGLSTL